MKSIRDVFEAAVQKNTNKTYLWFEGKEVTYSELYQKSANAANAFMQLGIEKGDRVALMLPNMPEFLYIWLGLNSIGASIVPINTFFKEEETSYVVNHSDAKLVVTHNDYYSIFEKVLSTCTKVEHCIVIDGDENSTNQLSFSQLLSKQSDIMPYVEIAWDDEASILYTSGTTGHPKGAYNPIPITC